MTDVPYSWQINVELYWPDGSRPIGTEISEIQAFHKEGSISYALGGNAGNINSVCQVDFGREIFYDQLGHEKPSLFFNVFNAGNHSLVYTSNVVDNVPNGSTIKLVIGEGAYLSAASWQVSGAITGETGNPVTEGFVKAFDIFNGIETLLGTSNLDQYGHYSVTYQESDFSQAGHSFPNLVIKVFDIQQSVIAQSELHNQASQNAVINIDLQSQLGSEYGVYGTVTNQWGQPVENIDVKAVHLTYLTTGFDEIDLGGWVKTDSLGNYRIEYDGSLISGLNPNCAISDSINLIVYAGNDSDPTRNSKSDLVTDAAKWQEVNVQVNRIVDSHATEFAGIEAVVSPCLGQSASTTIASMKDDENYFNFAVKATGINSELLRAYIDAWLLAEKINDIVGSSALSEPMSTEFIYGLIRVGIGSTLQDLINASSSTIIDAIARAVDKGIVTSDFSEKMFNQPPNYGPLINDWKIVYNAVATYTADTGDKGTWQKQLLELAVPPGDIGAVLDTFFDVGGDFKLLCEELLTNGVVSQDVIEDLVFVFDLYYAADRFIPIVKAVFEDKALNSWTTIGDLVTVPLDNVYQTGSSTIIIERGWYGYVSRCYSYSQGQLPFDVPGNTFEDRHWVYANRLYRVFSTSSPDTKFRADLTEMVAGTTDPLLQPISTFLNEHRDYSLDYDNIDQYCKDNSIAIGDFSEDARAKLRQLQRVFRLTPTLDTMMALIDAGLDSAYKISNIAEGTFVADYAESVGGLTSAQKIHRLASSFASEILYQVARYHSTLNAVGSGGAIPSAFDRAEIIKRANTTRFPSWITLFGDLNKCDCKHCQTVFSPSAYLVDLLQFLEDVPRQVLIKRRPDLADIELSCPNTNKVMPYIDLVIETLENAIFPLQFDVPDVAELVSITVDQGEVTLNNDEHPNLISIFVTHGFTLSKDATAKNQSFLETGHNEWHICDSSWRYIVEQTGDDPLNYTISPSPQTNGMNDDLEVYPDHINRKVYQQILINQVFPLNLPFNSGKEEVGIFLKHKDLPHYRVLENGRPEYTVDSTNASIEKKTQLFEYAIALAYLGISEVEANTALCRKFGISEWHLWGFDTDDAVSILRPDGPGSDPIVGTYKELLDRVPVFLHRSGLSYQEMLDLFDCRFVNVVAKENGGLLIIADEDDFRECNYNEYRINNIDTSDSTNPFDTTLKRIAVFLRLLKITGWTMQELDSYLVIVADNKIPTDDYSLTFPEEPIVKFWRELSDTKRVCATMNTVVHTVIAPLGYLDCYYSTRFPESPFAKVFLIGNKDEEQYNELLKVMADPAPGGTPYTISLSETALVNFRPTIAASLGISVNELESILAGYNATVLQSIDRQQLSMMYFRACFMGWAGITDAEHRGMINLLEGALIPERSAGEMLQFIEIVNTLRQSNLSLADVKYLLTLDHNDALDKQTAKELMEFSKERDKAFRSISEKYPDPLDNVDQIVAYVMAVEDVAIANIDILMEYMTKNVSDFDDAEKPAVRSRWEYLVGTTLNAVLKLDDPSDVTIYIERDFSVRRDDLSRRVLNYYRAPLQREAIIYILSSVLALNEDTTEKIAFDYQDKEKEWTTVPTGRWNGPFEVIAEVSTSGGGVSSENLLRYDCFIVPDSTDTYTISEETGGSTPIIRGISWNTAGGGFEDGVVSATVDLVAGAAYSLIVYVDLANAGQTPVIRWEADGLNETVPESSQIAATYEAYHLLKRASLLVNAMALSNTQIKFLNDADIFRFYGTDLLERPSSASANWPRFSTMMKAVQFDNETGLLSESVFELLTGMTSEVGRAGYYGFITSTTGWRADDVFMAAKMCWPDIDFPAPDEAPTAELDHLSTVQFWQFAVPLMETATSLGLTCRQLSETLIVPGDSSTSAMADVDSWLNLANDIRNNLKAKYSRDSWKKAFQPLRNELRQKQRDALTGYLCAYPIANMENLTFFDENDLYAYFLLDVEMEPDTLTSRIKMALSAIQLFIQRVFLGLEPTAEFSDVEVAKEQWKWIRNYRVWEANRKVFLYPENWIEPELRDDKTPFFDEFEDELMRDELTSKRAESLVAEYLDKMSETANLEIIGCHRDKTGGEGYVAQTHVFGKTKSNPHRLFYRSFIEKKKHQGTWTPWIHVDVETSPDLVVPFVFNARLFLAWPMFMRRQIVTKNKDDEKTEFWTEISLHWTEYTRETGKWSKVKRTKDPLFDKDDASVYQKSGEKPRDEKPRGEQYCLVTKYEDDGTFSIGVRKVIWDDSVKQMTSTTQSYVEKIMHIGHFNVKVDGDVSRHHKRNPEPGDFDFPSGTKVENNAAYDIDDAFVNYAGSDAGFILPEKEFVFHNALNGYRVFTPDFRFKKPDKFFFQRDGITLVGLRRGSHVIAGSDGKKVNDYKVSTFSHPLVREFQSRLTKEGLPGIMNRLTQALPKEDNRYYGNYYGNYYGYYYGSLYLGYYRAGDKQAWETTQRMFEQDYGPEKESVKRIYPLPTVEFDYGTPWGAYNWELFFHIPMMVAERLSQDMQYEEAMKWYHYVFDPLNHFHTYELTKRWMFNLPRGCKYWNFLPFFANKDATQSLSEAMGVDGLSSRDRAELAVLINDWKNDPFKPHLIARSRIVAYQKNVVLKYLDNLIAWADSLFRQDTIESINQATQLYILCNEILGKRPEKVQSVAHQKSYTYRELSRKGVDDFSNAVVEVEDLMVGNESYMKDIQTSEVKEPLASLLNMTMKLFCFQVPMNENLFKYWDIVADRLFKIRNSMNIDGVKRQLALFQPPIDPAMLVKAAAAGIDLGSVLSQLNAPLPHYRFNIWIQKAVDLCNEVKSFGAAILSALEKKDAESMSLLRSDHEIQMLKLVQKVKSTQVKEAEQQIEALNASKEITEKRYNFYKKIQKISSGEKSNIKYLSRAGRKDNVANTMNVIAGALAGSPQFMPLKPFVEFGGLHLGQIFSGIGTAIAATATAARNDANMVGILAGYGRRWNDWKLQESLAQKEMAQIDKQIVAAEIRLAIAEKEVENHEVSMEHAEEARAFMEDKFTNEELYQWMLSQLSKTYNEVYKLAFDVSKTAERTYQFELGTTDTDFIQFGYMDKLRKGLLAGEQLIAALKRMDIAYLENNRRELEITKPVSLKTFNVQALQELRETGVCEFEIPEVLFDLDYAGQYFRRIKTVSITIPCVTGPNTSVNAKLTLLNSCLRKDAGVGGGYAYTGLEDARFVHDLTGIQSVAMSTAQNDSGLFELNFRDERYLPFEGAGAVSRWKLELPEAVHQFDYNTISDVILTMKYTARDGGGLLKEAAEAELAARISNVRRWMQQSGDDVTGFTRLFSLKREFPDKLHKLLNPEMSSVSSSASVSIEQGHFPYFLTQFPQIDVAEQIVDVSGTPTPKKFIGIIVKLKSGALYSGIVTLDGVSTAQAQVERGEYIYLDYELPDNKKQSVLPGGTLTITQQELKAADIEDMMIQVSYTVSV